MTNGLYVGFRVEVTNKYIVRNFIRRFNSGQKTLQVSDLYKDGKIAIEKTDHMLIARGQKIDKSDTGLANFAALVEVGDYNELERLVKIINVLGNDRLIRERVYSFIGGKSILNAIPQLAPLKDAFVKIERLAPGFIKAGWYYAPEAIFGQI